MLDGLITQHMISHIVAMNVVAPAMALGLRHADLPLFRYVSQGLTPALILQLCLLWGWHVPNVLAAAHGSHVLMTLMHASLFICASWFWAATFAKAHTQGWHSLSALLVTGKLFCLLGVLLTFAPRPLYLGVGVSIEPSAMLADQQMAGLLMLVACPLTYVLAAIVIAARWTLRMDTAQGWTPRNGPD